MSGGGAAGAQSVSTLSAAIAFTVIFVALAWAVARALVVEIRLGHADAILVMAGAPVYFGRVAEAGRIFLEGRADKILLTNDGVRGSWSNTLQRNPLYYERATLRLIQAGVPTSRIELLPGAISGTYDEALLVRRYAQTHALHSLIIVTSDFHTRRTLLAARHALRGMPIEIGIERAAPFLGGLSPRGWYIVVGESIKLAYYYARYR
jgi:uncharacterized SAM-binding protein YcdF (DUF218 family)